MWSFNALSQIFPGVLAVLFGMSFSFSQIPNLQNYVDDALTQFPELAKIIDSPPLTTSFDDAVFGFPLLDDHEPEALRTLAEVPRSPSGAFLLEPGAYEGELHSYCLKPGTHGPGGGDGYLYGALRGPYADIVETILRESNSHNEISHGQIQMLLWAVISRAGIKGISPDLQWVAGRLLSWEQMYRLNGGALALVPKGTLEEVLGGVPKTVRKTLTAEASIREMLTRRNVSYADLERVAILTGVPSLNLSGPKIPKARWSVHPSGYLVRYFPEKVSRTRVQVWVPRHVTTKLDHLGRIVDVHDNWGNLLSLDYEDEGDPPRLLQSSDLRPAALNRLRWSRFDESGRVTETLILRGEASRTWYRQIRTPTDPAGVNAVQPGPHVGKDRYQDVIKRDRELERFSAGLPQECRHLSSVTPVLSNMVHLRNTLKSATHGSDPVARASLALLSDGIGAELRRQMSGKAGTHLARFTEFDPAPDVAVPASTGRQRLGLSARLH